MPGLRFCYSVHSGHFLAESSADIAQYRHQRCPWVFYRCEGFAISERSNDRFDFAPLPIVTDAFLEPNDNVTLVADATAIEDAGLGNLLMGSEISLGSRIGISPI